MFNPKVGLVNIWPSIFLECNKERKGKDMRPSMVTHTQNLCSAFNPSKCTRACTHTHTHTHREQLGVRCLAQGSHLSRGIEGGESAGHSLPLPTIPAGPETWTHNLWVTSPTLYPLGHDCPTCWFGALKTVMLILIFLWKHNFFHHSLMNTTA